MVNVWRAIRFTLVSALLLGLGYPLVVTGVGRLVFPYQSQGSMVKVNGRVVGSMLIAQRVTSPGLFHPRPSAVNYNADASGASNLGPTNPLLVRNVRKNLRQVERENPGIRPSQVPPSMVESSASGLDPDITVADALLQIPRISRATGLTQTYLKALVEKDEVFPAFGIWGTRMVNVMQVNLAIEQQLGKG